MTLEIHLSGIAAEAAEAATDLLRAVGRTEPLRRELISEPQATRGDAAVAAALILAVPSAVTASLDLVARAQVVEKIRNLRAALCSSEGAAVLKLGEHPYLDLKTATEDEIMDMVFTVSRLEV